MLTLDDVMSIVHEAVLADQPVEVAAARLEQHPRQPLVVVDRGGALLGVLRERHVLHATDPGQRCGALVDGPPRTLDASAPLPTAMRAGLDDDDGVIVVTRDGRPVGTLSGFDLARIAQQVLPEELRVSDLDLATPFVEVDAEQGPSAALARVAATGARYAVVRRRAMPIGVLSRDELAGARRLGVDRLGTALRRVVFPAGRSFAVRRVAHDLLRTRSHALPVLDVHGDLVGVVTLAQVAEAVRAGLERLPDAAVA